MEYLATPSWTRSRQATPQRDTETEFANPPPPVAQHEDCLTAKIWRALRWALGLPRLVRRRSPEKVPPLALREVWRRPVVADPGGRRRQLACRQAAVRLPPGAFQERHKG